MFVSSDTQKYGRVAAERDRRRDERSAAPAEHVAKERVDADRLRGPTGAPEDRHDRRKRALPREGVERRPEERVAGRRSAEDVLSRVEDEAVPAREVLRVAVGDVGVVEAHAVEGGGLREEADGGQTGDEERLVASRCHPCERSKPRALPTDEA